MKSIYIGYNIWERRFQDEDGNTVERGEVAQLVDSGRLDATMMAQRLITQFGYDHDALLKFYGEGA
jgi:hypothetical protein